ncbi:MAG: preprotein translocase subunit SecE [Candidatus Yanofskybacteria bacterium]|nr:preprotein translocase subunit SecE [Candidatus Yanofskybacteria bacterium]
MERILTFLREVRVELGKVSWPTRSQLFAYTGVVLGISLFFAIYLGGLDMLLAWVLSLVIG